jgi:hypothetical protein
MVEQCYSYNEIGGEEMLGTTIRAVAWLLCNEKIGASTLVLRATLGISERTKRFMEQWRTLTQIISELWASEVI